MPAVRSVTDAGRQHHHQAEAEQQRGDADDQVVRRERPVEQRAGGPRPARGRRRCRRQADRATAAPGRRPPALGVLVLAPARTRRQPHFHPRGHTCHLVSAFRPPAPGTSAACRATPPQLPAARQPALPLSLPYPAASRSCRSPEPAAAHLPAAPTSAAPHLLALPTSWRLRDSASRYHFVAQMYTATSVLGSARMAHVLSIRSERHGRSWSAERVFFARFRHGVRCAVRVTTRRMATILVRSGAGWPTARSAEGPGKSDHICCIARWRRCRNSVSEQCFATGAGRLRGECPLTSWIGERGRGCGVTGPFGRMGLWNLILSRGWCMRGPSAGRGRRWRRRCLLPAPTCRRGSRIRSAGTGG